MKQIILLTSTGLTHKVSRWVFISFGSVNFINGIYQLTKAPLSNWDIFLGLSLIATGIFVAVFYSIALSPNNKNSPKVTVDDTEITIKPDFFKSIRRFYWNEIRGIEFRPYALTFLLPESHEELVILRTNSETSIQIKKAIRELAEGKSIPITTR